jgi:hypothetical protein
MSFLVLFKLSDWWFSPMELWEYWLVHIVVPPMGLQADESIVMDL